MSEFAEQSISTVHQIEIPELGVSTMAKRKSTMSPKVAKKAAAKRAAAKPARRLGDWREETLDRMRRLILEADPEMIEERKWKKPSNGMVGVPVWSHDGIVCTGETYKQVVKLTFAKGASLKDPARLFNSSLEGNTRRAIDIREGEEVDAKAFQALVKAAVAQNGPPAKKAKPAKKPKASKLPKDEEGVVLLSGGNPQIAKANGDPPVQAFIAAMPGWKREVGRRLDALIVRTVPRVRKAMRWNTPFYGIEGPDGELAWFLGFHCITKYVKVAFFRGSSLRPLPPVESKQKEVRYLHIHEDEQLDEELVASWVRQASELPGEKLF